MLIKYVFHFRPAAFAGDITSQGSSPNVQAYSSRLRSLYHRITENYDKLLRKMIYIRWKLFYDRYRKQQKCKEIQGGWSCT